MKYVSLDIETTCIAPARPENILMVSMVVEDTSSPQVPVEELPHFTCFVSQPKLTGNPFALGMNAWILDYISGRTKNPPYPIYRCGTDAEYYLQRDWTSEALIFLVQHFGGTRVTVAGKNVAGFDLPFLPGRLRDCFRHRVIDPGALFLDWSSDTMVPDLAVCKQRAGIDTPVAHDAREDAMDVIRLLRTGYVQ